MNKQFFVNEEKGIVTCVLKAEEPIPNVIRQMKLDKQTEMILSMMLIQPQEDLFDTKEFIGVARCVEGDTFNEEIGKQIAELKAGIKYNQYVEKKFSKFVAKLATATSNVVETAILYRREAEGTRMALQDTLNEL